jgi:hypothetical protein
MTLKYLGTVKRLSNGVFNFIFVICNALFPPGIVDWACSTLA